MITIGSFEVSNTLGKMIKEDMEVYNEAPMTFTMDNKGITWGVHYHTDNKIQNLIKWANKVGAEIKVLGLEGSRILLEITDPIAISLEKYLK